MLALGIRYLNGFVTASHGRYEQVEWPPHPGRVFMAMVAAHYQTGADPAEREALLWLEAVPEAPQIHAPEVLSRAVVTQFVPVNPRYADEKAAREDERRRGKRPPPPLQSAPSVIRTRMPRTFARAWPSEDTAFLHWPKTDPPPGIRSALSSLCEKVTRLGHSSSLVQMWMADDVPAGLPRWIPADDRATHSLRVAGPGSLAALDHDFNREALTRFEQLLLAEEAASNEKARKAARKAQNTEFPNGPPHQRRPRLSVYRGYVRAEDTTPVPPVLQTVFSPHLLVFTLERLDGPHRCLDLACTLALTARWRDALVSTANDLSAAAQSALSGHGADKRPLEEPHLAFLPLGFVGHPHADGRLSGAALALPSEIAGQLRVEVLRAVSLVNELSLGRLGRWRLEPVTMVRPSLNLQAACWTAHPAGATRWSTVTPIAYDQHPKTRNKAAYLDEVAAMIATGCERIGLPRPREVIVTPVSAHLGAPPAHAFPRLLRKDGGERRHTHAILVFSEPVRGPILLGAGRYRGYGLCRPMGDASEHA